MPFLGLMLVSSHEAILEETKTTAFGEGQRHGRATAPKPVEQQPMIDSLRDQLDAANELKDGYLRTIEKLKKGLADQPELEAGIVEDAQKWRDRNERERARQQAKRANNSATAPKAPVKKAAPRKVRK